MGLALSFSLLCFVLGVLLFPFYVFDSGVPQPAHVLFLAGAVVAMMFGSRQSIGFMRSRISVSLILFVIYVFTLNVCTGLYLAPAEDSLWKAVSGALIYSMYYGFNAGVLIGIVCTYLNFLHFRRTEVFWNATLAAALLCLLVQCAIAVLDAGKGYHSYRAILYFNNPNQLGYFSVAACSILFVVQRYRPRGSQLWIIAGYVMAIYLAALSLSKAAFIAILLMPVLHTVAGGGGGINRLAAAVVTIAAVMLAAALVDDDVLGNLSHRLASIGVQSDDSLEGRAYDRLVEYPQHLVLGAGEGVRFTHEIHSLLASLLFSYGIVGFALFGSFVWMIFRRTGARPMLYLVPILLYNLTHNGIRSPLLWAVVALMLAGALTSRRTVTSRSGRAYRAVPGTP